MCPGYRDELALLFCDESSEVVHKAQAKQALKLRRRANESSTCSAKEPSVSCAPRLSPDTHGTEYFLANYVVNDSDSSSGHMQNLLSWKSTNSKTLLVAMEAVGLAGLSTQRSDPVLMAKARRQYALALRMTKTHLQDFAQCKQDRTITAVALLGLFEVRIMNRRRSFPHTHRPIGYDLLIFHVNEGLDKPYRRQHRLTKSAWDRFTKVRIWAYNLYPKSGTNCKLCVSCLSLQSKATD